MEKLTFRFLQRFESDFIKLGNLSRIAVAVSGGCDSVALLVLLKAFCEKKSIELAAFHVDHNLREDSQADANWVKALADKFKISFYQKKIAKPTESQLAERGVEDWARRVRYEAFSSMACEFGCKYIATGHTANDQTETYLIRLLRGTSIQGIKGIAPIKNLKIGENELFFWRPLLNSKRYELEEYLISIGQTWREDSTNKQKDYFRNKVRLDLIPMMEELIHGASDKINLAFEDIVEVSDWLVESASSQFETLKLSPSKLKIKNDIAPVILREIMSQWLIELGLVKFQNRKNIQQLVGLYHSASGAKVQFSSYTFLKQFETVEFFVNNPDKKDTDVIERQSLKREEIITFAGERVMLTQSPEKHFFRQGYWLEADLELENLFLAKRFPGAIFSPKTGGGSKKLKKWLIEKKIPVSEREKLTCLYLEDEVLWVIGHEVSMKLDREQKNSIWYLGVLSNAAE